METHFKLADLYTKQKLMADAIAELSILVSFYEKKGKLDEAADVLKKMVEADPQNIGVRLKLAEYCKKRGFTNDAIAEYVVACNSLVKDGKLDKAEKLYLELYAGNKKDIRIVEGLAEVYRLKNDNSQLVKYYKELANLYKENGDFEKRNSIYEKILAVYPNDKDALDILGRKTTPHEPFKKVAHSEAVSEERPSREPLISWPEVNIDLTLEGKAAPQEPSPIQAEEEPLVPWKEMIEVTQEVKPVESEETKPLEEIPAIEMPESSVVESAAEEGTIEEPVKGRGLDMSGIEEFLPKGFKVMGEMESASEEGYVDLSSELGLEEALDFLTESWESDAKGKDTFLEFKHGVEKQLSKEDSETHYNLGIAYMEMELYDDAMREFKIALKDPIFEFDCYNRQIQISGLLRQS